MNVMVEKKELGLVDIVLGYASLIIVVLALFVSYEQLVTLLEFGFYIWGAQLSLEVLRHLGIL